MRRLTLASIATLAGLTIATAGASQDWPQWRGPARDGVAPSFKVPATWPEKLTPRWKVDVGLGYATPLLVGNRIYMFTRQDAAEVMTALAPSSGRVIWRTSYPAPFKMNPATAHHGEGPKATPTYDSGRLFTLGITGIVTAFDAATGKQLWQRPADPVEPLYHTGQSPVVDGNLVIVHGRRPRQRRAHGIRRCHRS